MLILSPTVLCSLLAGPLCPSSLRALLTLLTRCLGLARANTERLVATLGPLAARPGLPAPVLGLALRCLARTVQHSTVQSEAGRAVAGAVPSMLQPTLAVQPGPAISSALQLLATVMSRYPGSCSHHRSRIRQYLVSLLVSASDPGVPPALLGTCLALLPQLGGGGRGGVEHSSQYSQLLTSLAATVHAGLSCLLEGQVELDHWSALLSTAAPPLELPACGGGRTERGLATASQLQRVLSALASLLTRGFPQPRCLQVELLLSLPCRLLGLTTPQSALLASLLPRLQATSLHLVSSLVASCGAALLPEAGTINTLVVTGLARQHSPATRTALYRLVATWCGAAGPACGLDHCASPLVTAMARDCGQPGQQSAQQPQPVPVGGRKKQRRKGGAAGRAVLADYSSETAADTATALAALQALLTAVGPWLDHETHCLAARLLLSLLLSSPVPSPAVLSCLQALLQVSTPALLSPLQVALPGLARLQSQPELAAPASSLLHSLEAALHPGRAGLQGPASHLLPPVPAPVRQQECEEVELVPVAVQTEEESEQTSLLDKSNSRIKELEEALKAARNSERKAKDELRKRDFEPERSLILAEKRVAKQNIDDNQNNTKKVKLTSVEEDIFDKDSFAFPPEPNQCSNNEESEEEEPSGEFTVSEMLQDFSDKLKSNLVPSVITGEESD